MNMWRDTVDLKLPMLDEFKVHFMRQRRTILSNYSSAARAWLTVLTSCKGEGSDQDALRELILEVTEFKDWAEASVQQLNHLGAQEALVDHIQELLKGPKES